MKQELSPPEPAPGHHFKQRDANSYDSVASRFDHLSGRLTSPLARHLLDQAELQGDERLLDLATGTGVVAREARTRLPRGKIVGVDLSLGMLRRASLHSRVGKMAGVAYVRADAEAPGLVEGSQDVVVSLFGLLHFPRPSGVLSQIYRTLRPGGRLVIGVGSGPVRWSRDGLGDGFRRLSALALCGLGLRLEAPRLLHCLLDDSMPRMAGDEEAPLAKRAGHLPREVPDLLRRAGFLVRQTTWRGHDALLESPEDFWQLQATFSSRGRKILAMAAPESVAMVRERFLERCRKVLDRGGCLAYPYGAFFVRADKPEEDHRVRSLICW